MKVILELLRIIFIFFLLGGILSKIIQSIYQSLGASIYIELGSLAIILLLFKFYRNYWQFSGWVKGYEKLPKKQNNYLTAMIVFLFILPIIISSF